MTPTDTHNEWVCPTCQTVHMVREGKIRVCVCGTFRRRDGEVVHPTKEQIEAAVRDKRTLAEYNHSKTGQVLRWGRSVARWIRYGRPTRTAEQIEALHNICLACKSYDSVRQACSICDCSVTLNQYAALNKLAMGTEGCPKGKWQPIVELSGSGNALCPSCGHGLDRRQRKLRRKRRRERKREKRRKRDGGSSETP